MDDTEEGKKDAEGVEILDNAPAPSLVSPTQSYVNLNVNMCTDVLYCKCI